MSANESTENASIHEYPMARFYTNGLGAGIFIISGIFANILVISNWLRDRGRWLPLYYYFLAFASWNLTLLISTLFFYSIPAVLRQPADQSTMICVPYFYVIGYTGANCCLTAVVWLMVVLTMERFVAVVLPFHTRVSSPRRRAKWISCLLSVLAILYNIPLIFELRIIPDSLSHNRSDPDDDEESIKYWTVDAAPFRNNLYYQTIYRVVFNLLFISLTPFCAISLLTFKIVYVIRLANIQRGMYKRAMFKEMNGAKISVCSSSNEDHHHSPVSHASTYGNILLTLFVVKFLICYTIPIALNVLELFLPPGAMDSVELHWVTDASDFLVILDSVSNAFLYSTWRKRIRFHKRKSTNLTSFSPLVNEERKRSVSCAEAKLLVM